MFETFCSSYKLLNTFIGHTIDYSTFDDCQFICSGSDDETVRVWDVDNKQIRSFNEHSDNVYRVKFSSYHYQSKLQDISSIEFFLNIIKKFETLLLPLRFKKEKRWKGDKFVKLFNNIIFKFF
ncbi:hypothetical protein RFI_00343 [Reticulomyxa filosa]|uniref:WD-40 repeat protein n=1 Tax=Reticulomyxa filosa TaxID=46433 RepID=X6PF85_RETFI|nr:hypothetical protein RFI_00343 [Reticulomyxa filosa]|eukprot:ETO36719.1 hypothetical protein RFI_00343 [Reticulomyxa filosa]